MVYRIFVEKKPGLAHEAQALLAEVHTQLQIDGVTSIRLLNRYDVEDIDEALFDYACRTVFSEPQLDVVTTDFAAPDAAAVFAVEYLPGQFDQRADSAAQCIQIISRGERPAVRTAKVYAIYGELSEAQLAAIKRYVINPVEAREASMEKPASLALSYEPPADVAVLDGFRELDEAGLAAFVSRYALAMDTDDAAFCQSYFRGERRDPTLTEIRVIDTYWSDHCRHTTFGTVIDSVHFEDPLLAQAWQRYLEARQAVGRTKPINLMDIATIAVKVLQKGGGLPRLDASEEINACTVKIKVDVDGEMQDWLLLFKNETHNHPTEIEPFGGAATCIGGAIRDPLSGRAYVYAAMRVTGAADPLKPVSETLPGKLPQRTIVTTAAAGYAAYGNQIGLATGIVDELYHPGYAAKRMEVGAVIAAAPTENVVRKRPQPGDVVLLLGGRTGRDGCGGATGSSKAHTLSSLETCGAEVQKGNAPEERKLQRLFRNPQASRLIKRCNDFGAGGVSVAIGELADGLCVNLDLVPKKYEGLDGTELAISESQERMAVVVASADEAAFLALAAQENLEATRVAVVTEAPRLVERWRGQTIVDLSREFLDSNGAEKHIDIVVPAAKDYARHIPAAADFAGCLREMASDLNVCSKRGLGERFDSTIGAATVLMPYGGRRQRTPVQAMVHKLPVESGHTNTCSFMAWAFNPYIAEKSPYHGAYLAVVESVCKLVATGASFEDVYLSFQEYYEKPGQDGRRWGKPLAALLGALKAQLALGVAAIGGKDSMSGTFEQLCVPPTLISFAVTTGEVATVISPEFKGAGHGVYVLRPALDAEGLPDADSLIALFGRVHALICAGRILSAWTCGYGGIAEGILKMTMGNGLGFAFADGWDLQALFGYSYGAFVVEMAEGAGAPEGGRLLGETTEARVLTYTGRKGEMEDVRQIVSLASLEALYEGKLEPVYPCRAAGEAAMMCASSASAEAASDMGAASGAAMGADVELASDTVTLHAPATDVAAASDIPVGDGATADEPNAAAARHSKAVTLHAPATDVAAASDIPVGDGVGKGPRASSNDVAAVVETARASACGAPALRTVRPRVLIPVFPGTNCEYDTARAMEQAGAQPDVCVIRNLTSEAVARSVEDFAARLRSAQILFIPGGFSGGDEPDGSGKFITAFFRNAQIRDGVHDLLDVRGGLMAGICNGFQALIKLGLVPYGKIIETDASCPTLTYNTIGRHQSKLVRVRIASNRSPWLARTQVGDIYAVPISHGEGRFLASDAMVRTLAAHGQIATQYVDEVGEPADDIQYNPNGSICAIEGITSPDGRVFGKMGHAERIGDGLYRNVPGRFDMGMFESAVQYCRK